MTIFNDKKKSTNCSHSNICKDFGTEFCLNICSNNLENNEEKKVSKYSTKNVKKEVTVVVPTASKKKLSNVLKVKIKERQASKKMRNAIVLMIITTILFSSSLYAFGFLTSNKLLSSNKTANTTGVSASVDIELYEDIDSRKKISVFHTFRQQFRQNSLKPNLALSDYIAPKESGINDYVGIFALSSGFGAESLMNKFDDDYNKIMVQALSDRLTEAFAEHLHRKNTHHGIMVAPGYPSWPDHSEKRIIFDLLEAEKNTGIPREL